jgi:hypothetical protein
MKLLVTLIALPAIPLAAALLFQPGTKYVIMNTAFGLDLDVDVNNNATGTYDWFWSSSTFAYRASYLETVNGWVAHYGENQRVCIK